MDTYIRALVQLPEIAARRECAECELRTTWKGNLFTLFVVFVVLVAILS